jgi:hypothetical protein
LASASLSAALGAAMPAMVGTLTMPSSKWTKSWS